MTVAPQTQQLQTDPAGSLQGRAVALGLRLSILRLAIGQLQRCRWEPQRTAQMQLHETAITARVSGGEPQVFIQIEAAPSGSQGGQVDRIPGAEPFSKSGVEGFHRPAGGQPQGLASGIRHQSLAELVLQMGRQSLDQGSFRRPLFQPVGETLHVPCRLNLSRVA